MYPLKYQDFCKIASHTPNHTLSSIYSCFVTHELVGGVASSDSLPRLTRELAKLREEMNSLLRQSIADQRAQMKEIM